MYKIFGQSIPMIDGEEKVTGRAKFAVDIEFPNMLYGKILRSPYAHARIKRIDVREAEALPGVVAIVTAEDTTKTPISLSPYPDQYVFAVNKVRYVGDDVAAVAAIDELTAEKALSLIKVEYEELPAVFSVDEALAPNAPLVHEHVEANTAHALEYERGDIASAWKQCAVTVEQSFTTSYAHPAYIEPQACTAMFDSHGCVDVYASTQKPGGILREKIAVALDIPIGNIRFHQTFVGGGFGGKVWQHVIPATVALAKKTQRPVRIVYTRREDLGTTPPRLPMQLHLKLGADAEGNILAKDTKIFGDNGAYNINSPVIVDTAATRVESLYRFKNIHTSAKLIYTNKIPGGTYRGFGNPQGTLMVENTMDMLAEKLGMDPLDLRLKNATQSGDVTAHGWKIGSCELTQCIEKAAELTQWKKRKAGRKPGYGIGMGCVIHVNGNRSCFPHFDGAVAYIRFTESGGITITCPDGDIGQGASTVFAQIAAETLGIPLKDIQVLRIDGAYSYFALGAFASRITLNTGNAVKHAAENAKRVMQETAATMLEESAPEEFVIEDGVARHSTGWSATLKEVCTKYIYTHCGAYPEGVGTYYPPDVIFPDKKTKYGNISAAYSFGAHVAQVQVDRITGKVQILDYVAVHDAGRLINPMLAEGQLEGGIVQGIGYALYEDYHFSAQGKVLNNSFLDYKLPTIMDIPPIRCHFVNSVDPNGPYGAKGIGEPCIVPVASAISNAISDAIGVRMHDMPYTAEKIKRAIQEKERVEG